MLNYSLTIVAGALGADCTVKEFDNSKVINFLLITNDVYFNSKKEKVEESTAYSVSYYVKKDSTFPEYLKKGTPVQVTGKMKSQSVEDGDNKKTYWSLKADQVDFTATGEKKSS